MREYVQAKLAELEIHPHMNGFEYIIESVEIIQSNDNKNITIKELCKNINKKYGCSYQTFEHSIRKCIDNSKKAKKLEHTTVKKFIFDLAYNFI